MRQGQWRHLVIAGLLIVGGGTLLFFESSSSRVIPEGFVEVVGVIDGDTLDVEVDGRVQRVRVLGINTPETVDPRKSVECFGKEASEHAKALLTHQSVRLEVDPSQDAIDRYGRWLRRVYFADGTDFGLLMIAEGYAYEYTYRTPSPTHHDGYVEAEAAARARNLGLWGEKCAE